MWVVFAFYLVELECEVVYRTRTTCEYVLAFQTFCNDYAYASDCGSGHVCFWENFGFVWIQCNTCVLLSLFVVRVGEHKWLVLCDIA
jgi:hypothetical protein